MDLKILTFNWHEPYICLLSHLGYEIDVIEPLVPAMGKCRKWDTNMRPLPANCNLVTEEEARGCLNEGQYNLLIAHNVRDAFWAEGSDLPKLMVFHNKLTTESGLGGNQVDLDKYREQVKTLTQDMKRVFISQTKQDDWGFEGDIIRPGIPLAEYGGYTGENAKVLRVGNMLRERDLMLGFTVGESILENFPSTTLGENPTLPNSRLSRGFDDLRQHYRTCRVFLNTTVNGYEDGYNLAMLEAMATGMPVISTENSTSPIKDGINGFISSDVTLLRQRVKGLLDDPELAREMGINARKTVEGEFSMSVFIRNWQKTIKDTLVEYVSRHKADTQDLTSIPRENGRLNIVLDTNGNPVTTAQYMERALRRKHNVVTCGSTFTQQNIQNWNMEALTWPIHNPEITRNHGEPIVDIIERLPQEQKPDMYLFVETGLNLIPPDLYKLSIPKACYLIDTHLHLENHIRMARHFDCVFIAQKEYLDRFREAGIEKVEWLPLACDPEVHGKQNVEKRHDIGFVGSILPTLPRRKQLLDELARSFNVHTDRKFMEEMTRVFCESRIVFNNAVRNDLNMRVFEALCSGSLLITDDAPNSGLKELFEDGKHLAIYKDERIVDTAGHYLRNPQEAERIAENGRQEVLARHTYDHRAEQLVTSVIKDMEISSDATDDSTDHSKENGYFHNVRHDVISMVPDTARCILEVGCGAGKTGEYLKDRNGAFVAGMELNEKAAAEAEKVLDEVIQGNIEEMDLPFNPKSFDCILFADVLEHLVDPLAALKKIKPLLKPNGAIIASLPNVQFYGVVHDLAEGKWTYQDEGILDRTHLRFFTLREMEKLFIDAGFDITAIEENLDGQYENIKNSGSRELRMGRVTLSDLTEEEMRQFFVFQYRFSARPILHSCNTENQPSIQIGQSIEEKLIHARTSHDKGDFDGALEMYRALCDAHPECSEAWVGQGNGLMRGNQLDEAKECYREAINQDPELEGAWLGLGAILLQQGHFEDAIQRYQKVLEKNAENDKALCGMGMAHEQSGRLQVAKDHYVKALNLQIENSPALASLLKVSYALEEFVEVEEALVRFLELHPANLQMMFALAGIQFKSGKWDEIQQTLDSILMFEPGHEDALALLEKIQSQTINSGH